MTVAGNRNASKGTGAARKQAAPKPKQTDDTPAAPPLSHHIQPTGDRRQRFRKD